MKLRAAVAFAVVALLLYPSVVQPTIELVSKSLEGDGGARYADILSKPAHLSALWNSLLLSVLTVAVSAILGVPLAFLTRDIGRPGKWLGRLALAPLFLSPVLGTMSFHYLFGKGGVLRHFFPWLDYDFRGFGAALVVHALTMFVYFFLFVSAALARFDWELVSAARSLGASRTRAFWTVVIPMLRPALFGATALTFMASMASFTAPYVFGGRERYLTTAIFIARKDDPATASALAVLLAVTSLLCAFFFQKSGEDTVSTASKGAPPALGRRSPLAIALKTCVATLVVFATLLPLATLVLLSFKPAGRIGSEALLSDLTTKHYGAIVGSVLSGDRSGPAGELMASIGRSLLYGAVATVANVVFALLLVIGVPARWRYGKRILSLLALLPIAIPGTVLALALLEAFASRGPFGLGPALAQTAAILPFAYFVRNMPIQVQATSAAAAQLPPSLPEASRTLGAGPLRTFVRVTLPLIFPGVAAGALMAFLVATGEFVASILLYTPRTTPAAVAIYAEFSQGELGTAAAAGTLLMVVVLAIAGLLSAIVWSKRLRPAAT